MKQRHSTRQRKFDLCNIARPPQQQLSSCFHSDAGTKLVDCSQRMSTLDHDGVQYSRFPINVARKPSLSDWSRKPWIRITRSTYGTMKQAADIAGHVICVCGNWVVIVNTDTETFGDFSRRKQNACGFYRYFLPYPCTSAKCNQMCTILVTHCERLPKVLKTRCGSESASHNIAVVCKIVTSNEMYNFVTATLKK